VPTYQYICNDCGESLEAVQKFSDDALTECPACGGKLRKVYSAVGVVFKGSGFYRNDSRSTSTSATPAADKTEQKSGSKTDTAPAAAASTSSSGDGAGSSSSTPSTPPAAKKSGDSKVA
jgi:putative FmdB family regulatory protein